MNDQIDNTSSSESRDNNELQEIMEDVPNGDQLPISWSHFTRWQKQKYLEAYHHKVTWKYTLKGTVENKKVKIPEPKPSSSR